MCTICAASVFDLVYGRILTRLLYQRILKYDIETFCGRVFSMFDGKEYTVVLKCDNSVMKDVVDRFGHGVTTHVHDAVSFIAKVNVYVSPTFFAWVFTYGGKIQILDPPVVRNEFLKTIQQVLSGNA